MRKGLLHHLEINVSSLKESLDFWDWFLTELGYEVYQQWEAGQSYKLEEMYIVFVQTNDKFNDIPYHRSRVGLNHLAFHASSRAQVDQMTIQLEAKGVSILYKDRHPFAGGPTHYAVFFEDPDRIKVELLAPVKLY